MSLNFSNQTFSFQRFRRLRPTTIRRIIALLICVCALGLALSESLRPRSGYIRVVVGAKAVAAGHTLAEGDVTVKEFPRELVPATAVTELADAAGRTLAIGMSAGEILTEQRMVGPSLAGALTGTSESKIIAITLADAGIVSALRTGDSVDIVSTASESGAAAPLAHGARVVNIVEDEVVLVALPAGAAEVVAATSLTSPLTLLLAG
ncbi:MAG: SAF domain-containing protein [Corynebacterium sp.]|uniref:SAF domain-containing protein n=1 Tax=Corynebacterium sp. TaxID=1720 RepID=UPI0026DAA7C1|nr:SAF domain-containing protein [Corynebacterium sp.]MDO5030495.1 SAF domain-containing protein [Corynebacterium sp.]